MANSASAKKRIRQNIKCRARNRWRKASYRNEIKAYDELVLHGSIEDTEAKLKDIYKMLDQVASTPAMHKNTAARTKSRLTLRLNAKRSATD